MAGNAENEADSEAKKWFVIAVIGTILYVSAVFMFVITADVEHEQAAQIGHEAPAGEH